MADAQTLQRPELTLPPEEAAYIRAAYARAETILEYGSGGSTVLAAEMGKRVLAVESDRRWARMMRQWFAANPPRARVDILWADVGPTERWGYPADASGWQRYARYPLGVWDSAGFDAPDTVLVDGRFRVGCALATAFRTRRPVTLYFDDYVDRPHYHAVEGYIGAPAETLGRMARFDLDPMPLPPERLSRIIDFMTTP